MIQVIHGKKGSGKTKRILDQANEAIKEHKGDVIFIDDLESNRLAAEQTVHWRTFPSIEALKTDAKL